MQDYEYRVRVETLKRTEIDLVALKPFSNGNPCPHCHCYSLVGEICTMGGKFLYCLLCSRRFRENNGRRELPLKYEEKRRNYNAINND